MSSNPQLRLSDQESLLLKTSLLPGWIATQTWESWLATLDLEKDIIPADCFLLMPLVYKNLSGVQPEPAQLNRLKGIYHQAWYRSQLGLQQITSVLEQMLEKRLKFCLLDDTSWIVKSLQELATRPDFEFSIYLPQPDFLIACKHLQDSGWKAHYFSFPLHRSDLRYTKSNSLGFHITWRPFPLAPLPANSTLIDRSKPRMLDGIHFLAAQPLDCWLYASCQSIYGDWIGRLRYLANIGHMLQTQQFSKPTAQALASQLLASDALSTTLTALDLPMAHQFLQSAPMLKPLLRERLTAWLMNNLHPKIQYIRRYWRSLHTN